MSICRWRASHRTWNRRRPMLPKLHSLTASRRRLLGSAAMTVLASHLSMPGSARARTTTITAGAQPAREEAIMTTTATPATATAAINPFQVNVPLADLDDLHQRLAAIRWPTQE